MVCLGVAAEFSKQRLRHEGPLTDAASEWQQRVNSCLMDAMQLQRTHCADLTVEYADCIERWTTENVMNKAPWKCVGLRRTVEECVVNNKDYLAMQAKYETEIPKEKIGEKSYLKLLNNWKDKTDEEKKAVIEKLSVP